MVNNAFVPCTIGQRVSWLRKHVHKMQQKELANAMGISAGYLSEVETDKKEPGAKYLVKLADALDTSIDYLLLRTDSPVNHRSCHENQHAQS